MQLFTASSIIVLYISCNVLDCHSLYRYEQNKTKETMMDKCQLCNKLEDERNTQEQCGLSICLSCDGKYTDEEIFQLINYKE